MTCLTFHNKKLNQWFGKSVTWSAVTLYRRLKRGDENYLPNILRIVDALSFFLILGSLSFLTSKKFFCLLNFHENNEKGWSQTKLAKVIKVKVKVTWSHLSITLPQHLVTSPGLSRRPPWLKNGKLSFFDKSGISIIPIISLPNFKVSCLFGTIITHIIIVSWIYHEYQQHHQQSPPMVVKMIVNAMVVHQHQRRHDLPSVDHLNQSTISCSTLTDKLSLFLIFRSYQTLHVPPVQKHFRHH